jgi:carbon monoxide dehydrogenase subunit G
MAGLCLQSSFQAPRKGLSPGATARGGRQRDKETAPMAMTMTGEVQLPATREVVYAKLNDPDVLKACIPGCEELNKTSDTEFQAVATTKIGPVKARFRGKVHLSDLDPPNGYRISGEGDGGVAGFAKGGATVALTEKDGGTLLTYNVEAQIGGKLAQLGQRLVNGAAKKIADEFFKNFVTVVSRG